MRFYSVQRSGGSGHLQEPEQSRFWGEEIVFHPNNVPMSKLSGLKVSVLKISTKNKVMMCMISWPTGVSLGYTSQLTYGL